MDRSTVLVTDVASPRQLERTLRAVVATVPGDVRVVVAANRPVRLPRQVQRRATVHTPRPGEKPRIEDAVRAAEEGASCTVVLRSDCEVGRGWWQSVLSAAQRCAPATLLVGKPDVHVLALPAVTGPRGGAQHVTSLPGVSSAVNAPSTVSAVVIAKDEADVIEKCVRAVTTFVDEVVVYDTGSTDATAEIAASAGAVVVHGYWDDDFAAARNRALTHATGEWVFSVDADEVARGDAEQWRAFVAGLTSDAALVQINSRVFASSTTSTSNRGVRLFRRAAMHWEGALHEHVLTAAGEVPTIAAVAAPVELEHSGYQVSVIADKGKQSRNVDIARRGLDAALRERSGVAEAWCSYARSLTLAHRWAEALDAFDEVLRQDPGPVVLAIAGPSAVECALSDARVELAEAWLDRMADAGEAPGRVAVGRARCHLARGHLDDAAAQLDLVEDGVDLWGGAFHARSAVSLRAEVLRRRGETSTALRLVADDVVRPGSSVQLETLLAVVRAAGGDLGALAATASEDFVQQSLREGMTLPPPEADAWFDALLQHRGSTGALVAGVLTCRHLPLDRVLHWSLAVRARGAGERCPLRELVRDPRRSADEQLRALAVLGGLLADAEAAAELSARSATLTEADRSSLRTFLPECAALLGGGQPSRVLASQG